jgi:hypothetical protein
MRVEREVEKGYRIVVETKNSILEMRDVSDVSLAGDTVRFICRDNEEHELPLGARGFRRLRRKMWRADFLKQWGVGKVFFAGIVVFLAVYFAGLVAVEYATSDGACEGQDLAQEQALDAQPPVPAEAWRP